MDLTHRADQGRAILWSLMVLYILFTTWNYVSLETDDDFRRSRQPNASVATSVSTQRTWPFLDHELHVSYLRELVAQVDAQPKQPLSPAVQRLKDTIEARSHLYMYFIEMLTELPPELPYEQGDILIRDYDHMLQVLNQITKAAPRAGMVIPLPPIALLLTYPASTASGRAAFTDPEVNRLMKGILNEWAAFLGSSDSQPSLNNGSGTGWLEPQSIKDLEHVANLPLDTAASFSELFDCDTTKDYYGFDSWDQFFTRRFRPHMRPVAYPEDDNVVVNPCESVLHTAGMKAKLRDTFFIKDQPYSVLDMLGHHPVAQKFEDAMVYQGFLSLHSYHRWHAPISGKIHSAYVVDGTYYSLPRFQGVDRPGSDVHKRPPGFGNAMRYLSEMATRAVIVIEADNPDLGLVAFIAVGMVEISTCDITAKVGQHVQKGDEIGSFHFGGSSYCLLFQDGIELTDLPPLGNFSSPNLPVLGKLGVITTSTSELRK